MLVHAEEVDDLRYHAGDGRQLVFLHQIGLDVDPDDDFGTQAAGHVCREIVQYAPVHQHAVVRSHRGKDAGDGHTRPHGLHEVPAGHHDLFAVEEVCRHAGKGDGQLQEVEGVVVADGEVGEEIVDVLPADESRGTLFPPVKREGKEVLAVLFLFPERKVVAVHFIA